MCRVSRPRSDHDPHRAPKACSFVGCLNPSTAKGRCPEHAHVPWQGSYRPPPEWPRIRREVLKAEPRCRMCKAPASTVDHVVPVAEGGSHGRANLQSLCRACHKAKTAEDSARGRQRYRG